MRLGRPPETISEEEVHALGEDLLIWIAAEGKGCIQFVRWYFGKHNLTVDDWRNLKKRDSFRPYHELAMKLISENVVTNKDIPQSYGNRYLCYYDRDLLEHEEAIKDRDANRGKDEKKNINADQLHLLADCLSRFSALNKPSKDREVSENHSE
jgi:hypothetical protein